MSGYCNCPPDPQPVPTGMSTDGSAEFAGRAIKAAMTGGMSGDVGADPKPGSLEYAQMVADRYGDMEDAAVEDGMDPAPTDEPCLCETDFTCLARQHVTANPPSGDVGAAENPEFECQGCGARATDDGADSLLGWSHDESGELAFCAACAPFGDAGAEVAAVLAEGLSRHSLARPYGESAVWCVCLRWSTERTEDRLADERAYGAHVADDIAPLIDQGMEAAKAEALREAADEAEALRTFAHGKNPTSEAHAIGYGTARRLIVRLLRDRAATLDPEATP